jgi:hypothetical protein
MLSFLRGEEVSKFNVGDVRMNLTSATVTGSLQIRVLWRKIEARLWSMKCMGFLGEMHVSRKDKVYLSQ